MRGVVCLGLVVVGLTTASSVGSPAVAQAPASQVIDRTYACATRPSGGIFEIAARARSGFGAIGSAGWDHPALAGIETGTDTGGPGTGLDNDLAWVTAGRPSHNATVIEQSYGNYTAVTWGTLAVNTRFCKPVSTRIPLTSAGLAGGSAGPLGEAFDCTVPRRVLLRVRAVTESPGLKRYRQFIRMLEPLAQATIAVRAQSGRPLIYAEVRETGKARLFTARGCAPD
jgi:hypothetical protein